MTLKLSLLTLLSLVLLQPASGSPDSLLVITGTVYNARYGPVPYTHVIGLNTGIGDVTDTLGIFRLKVMKTDTLLFLNIAYQDTLIPVADLIGFPVLLLKDKYYNLHEARIFNWGSSYDDFREAIVTMPHQPSLGESLGLPRQDSDYVPIEMDEQRISSLGYLIKSPIYFFYYNFSKMERSARKVFWIERDMDKIALFEAALDAQNISAITGLQDQALEDFMVYLNANFQCTYHCSEIEILSEIHRHWDTYSSINNKQ